MGRSAAELEFQMAEKLGLLQIRKVSARLDEYEKARDRYPTLADFYPRLLDVFPPSR